MMNDEGLGRRNRDERIRGRTRMGTRIRPHGCSRLILTRHFWPAVGLGRLGLPDVQFGLLSDCFFAGKGYGGALDGPTTVCRFARDREPSPRGAKARATKA